ncbi:MAG: Mur ligase domain-containing protein, partial [Intestinibacillus sp.]
MKLQELLQGVAASCATAPMDAEIGEVRYDSRAVRPGDLFVAIRGYATDGHRYIGKALEQGAAAVVCEEAPEGIPAVVVADSRAALAEIAANRFGHPADVMTMIGVTGTNGKTTTTYLVKHILESQGHKVGLIGTNQNLIGG